MISCEEYDYIEIACLYRYLIKLTLSEGNPVEGVALDTRRNSKKEECIQVGIKADDTELVVLDDILKLEVCVAVSYTHLRAHETREDLV